VAVERPRCTGDSIKYAIRITQEERGEIGAVNSKPSLGSAAFVELSSSYHGKRVKTRGNPVAIHEDMLPPARIGGRMLGDLYIESEDINKWV
jgi:hypothetical protein